MRRLAPLLLLAVFSAAFSQQQVINIGTPGGAGGDPAYIWAGKDNSNFAQLFSTLAPALNGVITTPGLGNTTSWSAFPTETALCNPGGTSAAPVACTVSQLLTMLNITSVGTISALTGDVTASGTGSVPATISVGAVTDTKASIAVKPPVCCVATANLTLSGLQTIDGHVGVANDLVLATGQTTASQNGPWLMVSGSWLRPSWYPSAGTTQSFQFIETMVRLGTVYQGSVWRQTAAAPITIDTTATTWVVTPLQLNASTLASSTGTGAPVLATSPSLVTPNIGAATASSLTDSGITGSTQCLHASTAGLISGTGSDCGAGTPAFSAITSATNTTAALVVGTGASLAASGSGTIGATSVPATGIASGNLPSGVLSSVGAVLDDVSSAHTLTNKKVIENTRLVTASGAVTVGTSDYNVCVDLTVPAAVVVNLPATPVTGNSYTISDCAGNAAEYNLTVTPAAGNIDGSATYVLNSNWGGWSGYYDGVQWKTRAGQAVAAVIPTALPKRRQRVVLIGDSLLQNTFSTVQVNTATGGFVVSGGVATISTSSSGNHNIILGNYFHIWNPGDTTYAADINGEDVLPLTVPTATTLTFATTLANGDYSSAYSSNWIIHPLYETQDISYFSWLRWFNKVPWVMVADYAQGGTTTTNMLTILPKILAGPKFDTAFLQTGTNDLQATSTITTAMAAAATALANITTIANAITATGAQVVIGIPPMVGAAHTNAQILNIAFNQLRTGLLQLAQSNNQIQIIDVFANMGLGTSTTGDFVSGYDISGDLVHPSTQGSIAMARDVNVAAFAVPTVDIQDTTILDDTSTYTSTNAPSPNILPHGGMDGTSGTVSSPATGTSPTGWSITSVTGTAASVGNAARSAITGSNAAHWGFGWTVNASWSGGQGYTLQSPSFPSLVVPGSWYRAGFTVKALGNSTLHTQLYGQLFFNGTGNVLASAYFNQYNSALNNGYPLVTGDVLEFQSEPVFIPVGTTITSALMQIFVAGTNGGSANLEFSSAFVRQVPNPYQ